ncbi:MAG TPA: reverse transcriptase domain-containing protein [Caulobacteraceae bacterium]|jgi:hypothetical protein
MAVPLHNYEFSYRNSKGKPVFVPTKKTRSIAREIYREVGLRFEAKDHFYHLRKGAHIAALHAHRAQTYFARIDLKNFFYSVGRNRVKAALKAVGVPSPERYARWSCVRNPYRRPSYALPYGFPQSPLLATLVLQSSALGAAIEAMPPEIFRSVYLDDVAISANDLGALEFAFQRLLGAVEHGNFVLNEGKVVGPAKQIEIFNCELARGHAEVTEKRVSEFYATPRSAESVAGFETYRASVAVGSAI